MVVAVALVLLSPVLAVPVAAALAAPAELVQPGQLTRAAAPVDLKHHQRAQQAAAES